MSYLVDTSVLIDFLRKKSEALAWMQSLDDNAAMSVVSIAELLAGARRQSEEREIKDLIASLKIHDVSADIAKLAGSHVRHFGASHSVEVADTLIAAAAEHHGLKLATLNVKHFPMFRRLKAPY